MEQIASWGLYFLLGALAYTAAHMTIVEYRESKRLEKETQSRHPTALDYGRLDHLDGLAYREMDKP
jgi:hypothetical protein